MTRLHKITIGIFCGGILLSGIGAGVAFGEFSGLAYGGAEVVGKTDIVTRDISKEIDPEQGVWNIDGYWDTAPDVEADESIPIKTWWSRGSKRPSRRMTITMTTPIPGGRPVTRPWSFAATGRIRTRVIFRI